MMELNYWLLAFFIDGKQCRLPDRNLTAKRSGNQNSSDKFPIF